MIGLDGQEIPNSNIGVMVATLLANSNLGNARKTVGWALDLHAGKVLYLSDQEYNLFVNFITNNPNISDLLEVRILELLK